MSEIQRSSRILRTVRELSASLFLIVLCIWFSITIPVFRDPDNIKDVLVQISGIAIAAAGMTFVIITAGIDLSVGSVLALAGCAGTLVALKLSHGTGWTAQSAVCVPLGFATALATGAAAGWVNGIAITKLRLPPFIMTLGTMSIARGLAYQVSNNSPVAAVPGMRLIAQAHPFGVPFPIILLVTVYAVCWFLLRYTRVGRYSFAIGGNEEAARLSGVRIDLYKIIVYTMCGALSAISGLILAGRVGVGQPQEGDGFELDVIAAVVIGGTSLAGGEGSLVYTLLGALIMGIVRNGLALKNVDYNLQKVVIGLIIIVAVAVDVFTKKQSEKA